MCETCGASREEKTRPYMFFCEDVNADIFCSIFFTFTVMMRSGWWIMWGVAKVIFQAGKFIVLYSLSCVICKLLTISKIITAILSTLESLELHYVHMFCVHAYTLPHSTFTHTCTEFRERKLTARLLILLLQNIWQCCWTSPQKIHPPVLQWARDSEREQPAMKASTAWTVNTVNKKQSHDNS